MVIDTRPLSQLEALVRSLDLEIKTDVPLSHDPKLQTLDALRGAPFQNPEKGQDSARSATAGKGRSNVDSFNKSLSLQKASLHFVESDERTAASLAFCFLLPSSPQLVKTLAHTRLLDLFQYAAQEGLNGVLTLAGGATFAEALLPLHDETAAVLMVGHHQRASLSLCMALRSTWRFFFRCASVCLLDPNGGCKDRHGYHQSPGRNNLHLRRVGVSEERGRGPQKPVHTPGHSTCRAKRGFLRSGQRLFPPDLWFFEQQHTLREYTRAYRSPTHPAKAAFAVARGKLSSALGCVSKAEEHPPRKQVLCLSVSSEIANGVSLHLPPRTYHHLQKAALQLLLHRLTPSSLQVLVQNPRADAECREIERVTFIRCLQRPLPQEVLRSWNAVLQKSSQETISRMKELGLHLPSPNPFAGWTVEAEETNVSAEDGFGGRPADPGRPGRLFRRVVKSLVSKKTRKAFSNASMRLRAPWKDASSSHVGGGLSWQDRRPLLPLRFSETHPCHSRCSVFFRRAPKTGDPRTYLTLALNAWPGTKRELNQPPSTAAAADVSDLRRESRQGLSLLSLFQDRNSRLAKLP